MGFGGFGVGAIFRYYSGYPINATVGSVVYGDRDIPNWIDDAPDGAAIDDMYGGPGFDHMEGDGAGDGVSEPLASEPASTVPGEAGQPPKAVTR